MRYQIMYSCQREIAPDNCLKQQRSLYSKLLQWWRDIQHNSTETQNGIVFKYKGELTA